MEQGHSLAVRRSGELRPVDVTTWPHPGFPTDLQAPYVSLMTQAQGRSAMVSGPARLRGARVAAPDIRSGAALVVAGLCASGTTVIDNVFHLERGYEDLELKLRTLGAHVFREDDARDPERPDLSKVVGD